MKAESRRDGRRPWTILLVTAFSLSTVLRLALAARLPLGDDEAYYWLWAQHLAWGYPDHPPVIAVLIALGRHLLGDSPLAVRSVPLVFSLATFPLFYVTTRVLFERAAAQRATFLAIILPTVTIGGVLASPDVPLVFFWLAAVGAGWRALSAGGWWWIATGAAVGLALLSKLTAVLLIVGLAGAWRSGNWRRSLHDWGWYGGLALGIVLVLPVIAWNAQHDWLMLKTIRYGAPIIPGNLAASALLLLVGHVVYFGPVVAWLLAAVVVAVRRRHEPLWRYIAWLSVPTFLAAALSLVAGKGRPHWPAPAYLIAATALAAEWPAWLRRRPALLRTPVVLTAGLTIVLGILILTVDIAPFFGDFALPAERVAREASTRGAFILADAYQTASQLSYSLGPHPPLLVTSHEGAFPLWNPPRELAGRTIVFVSGLRPDPTPYLGRVCRNILRLGILSEGKGRPVPLYSCEDFTGSYAGFPRPDTP